MNNAYFEQTVRFLEVIASIFKVFAPALSLSSILIKFTFIFQRMQGGSLAKLKLKQHNNSRLIVKGLGQKTK